MGSLVLFTGPVRSGKSREAVVRASAFQDVAFVATYRPDPGDPEMAERVRRHRAERPDHWITLEAPEDVAASLAEVAPQCAIVDCLSLWLGDRLHRTDEEILAAWRSQLDALRASPWITCLVTNEVGWSPVPDSSLLRRYRDLLGLLNQRTAAAAEEVWLMVAGCGMRLK